ncbi:MAG: energy transducer TonB [Gemmatimonas sp.]|jgi:protein TonB
MPDERPRLLNAEVPFRYPVSLYLQRVQGNVTLRLFVDADGRVVTDSTRIVESSGHREFDAAALAGARMLSFRPARRGDTPVPVALLYPVHFRLPPGTVPAGDSLSQLHAYAW